MRDVTLDDADAVSPNPLPQHGPNCFLAWSLEAGFRTGVHRLPGSCWGEGGVGGRALGPQATPVLEEGEGHKRGFIS